MATVAAVPLLHGASNKVPTGSETVKALVCAAKGLYENDWAGGKNVHFRVHSNDL